MTSLQMGNGPILYNIAPIEQIIQDERNIPQAVIRPKNEVVEGQASETTIDEVTDMIV